MWRKTLYSGDENKVSRHKHRKLKYRWSEGLQKEALDKLEKMNLN